MANQTARVNVRLKALHDGLTNVVSSIGTAKDKVTWNQYSYRPLNRYELEAIYFEDWIGRKAVDLVPEDMTREWRSWTTEDAEAIYEEEKRLDVRAKVALALKWERLYGGAAILIGTGDANPEEPLDLERLSRGGLKYLHVFSRYELQADPELETDLASPDYGKPRWYSPILTGNTTAIGVRIHRSRFIVFDGLDVPRSWREANEGWGMPVYQHLRQAIINAAATNANVAALIEEAKLDVVKVPDLDARLSDPESERRVIKRFALASQLKSTLNTLLLGTGEEFDRKQTTFSGLTDVMKAQLQIVSGALDMPVTRFLGQSPQGMAASGDTELRIYYDMIRSKQSTDLAGVLAPLDEAVVRSAKGAYQKGTAYEWAELWTPTPEERSKIEKAQAETDKTYVDLGIFPTEGFAKAIRDRLIEQGTYPSLDQHVQEGDISGGDEADPEDVVIEGPDGDDERERQTADASPRTLYVNRRVLNAADIIAWARKQGFGSTLAASDMHVTIAFSRTPVDWMKVGEPWSSKIEIPEGGPRLVEKFGGGAIVLLFNSSELTWRHDAIRDAGASWDWPEYQPHITITYEAGDVDLSKVEPYRGKIVLGPEIFEEVDEDWKAKATEK